MKLYISSESQMRLKGTFTNLSKFNIIDIDDIKDMYNLDVTKNTDAYLLNSEIIRAFEMSLKSKKYIGIIYINSKINADVVNAIKNTLRTIENGRDTDVVLLDDYNLPKHKDISKLFDEVVYFPMFKKMKLIECKAINPNEK